MINDEEVKPIPKPRAPAQAPLEIVSQEEVKEKSEWDSDNEKSPAKKIPDKDEQVASDEKGAASPNENQESKEYEYKVALGKFQIQCGRYIVQLASVK